MPAARPPSAQHLQGGGPGPLEPLGAASPGGRAPGGAAAAARARSEGRRQAAGPGLRHGGGGAAGGSAAMRAVWVLLPALAALSAYYVYLPLPGTVSDSWKLMLLDATFRAVQQTVRRGAGGQPWGWPLWWW